MKSMLLGRRVGFYAIVLTLVIGMVGCVERFVADVDPPSPRPLVVDGAVTSGPGPHTVTLSSAAAFEQSVEGTSDRVEEADVAIIDRTADSRVQLDETQRGKYETEKGELVGQPGHTYRLEVVLPDGRAYHSEPTEMPEPVPLDSVYVEYDASPAERIEVMAEADDPEGTDNFYRWSTRVTREYYIDSNSPPFYCWARETGLPNQVPLLSDRLIEGGEIRNQEVYTVSLGPGAARINQVDVRQFTLTEDAYDFWSRVEEQVEEVDNPFSAPPAPIRGNVVSEQDSLGNALGYFEVAGKSEQVTLCFKQSDFEEAPRPAPVPSGCPEFGQYERPSYWVCSPVQGQ